MLADNIVHFSRLLRGAGLAVGTDRVLAAIAAVQAVGVQRRDDFRAALGAVMMERHEQQFLFDAAFDVFWREPHAQEAGSPFGLPIGDERDAHPAVRRLAQALADRVRTGSSAPSAEAHRKRGSPEFTPAVSERERLQHADFQAMTAAEYEQAKHVVEHAPLPFQPVRRRRHEASPRGSLDLRRMVQRMAHQPQTMALAHTRPRSELPPLVVLLDISGSMQRYSRLFLHYVHGLVRRHLNVHTFTFGTRLTNITRCLRERDPDVAMKMADELVQDWKGGTRIASSLDEFNRLWARRVLGANAAVLLVTDGLERDEGGLLAQAAAQLHRCAHELAWLNPLLRFEGFEPRAAGVRTLLAHVDRFLPVHNLASLADLALALLRPAQSPARMLRNGHAARDGASDGTWNMASKVASKAARQAASGNNPGS